MICDIIWDNFSFFFFFSNFRWACIILTTLLIRGATLPLVINQLKATSKLTVCCGFTCCCFFLSPNIYIYIYILFSFRFLFEFGNMLDISTCHVVSLKVEVFQNISKFITWLITSLLWSSWSSLTEKSIFRILNSFMKFLEFSFWKLHFQNFEFLYHV